MSSNFKIILIIILIVLAIMITSIGFLWLDQKLYETRGYGLIGRPDAPYGRADRKLHNISRLYEKHMERFSGKRPDPNTIIEGVPDLVLASKQPYKEFGSYVFKADKIKQVFLYNPNNFIADYKVSKIRSKFDLSTTDAEGFSHIRFAECVLACVLATRISPDGVYVPYEEYPLVYKKTIGFKAWKEWCYIIETDWMVTHIQSEIPPIPGCFAYIDRKEPDFSKFYYPEEIIPIFKAIYPNANIPEDQILREGRDY